MQRGFGDLALTMAVALGFLALPGSAIALDFVVTRPIAYDNMVVYPVKGDNARAFGTSGLLTVEQAEQQGLIRIHHNSDGSVSVDNLSTQGVFVPFGTLLSGGRQDQVVGTSQFLAPKAQNVPLGVFCVDPFRSTARPHENANEFSTSGDLIPSQTARLSMLLSNVDTRAVARLRQSGVWWSIDTLRSNLEKQLGVALDPPEPAPWTRNFDSANRATIVLSQRESNWTSSLPLALSSPRLVEAQAGYAKAFRGVVQTDGNIIGAVFAVNGQVIGAELYASPELFRLMWPHLLRAYATIAISQREEHIARSPSTREVNEILSDASSNQAEGWTINDFTRIQNTQSSLYIEDRDLYGDWIQRTYLSKVLPKRQFPRPDELVVDSLNLKHVNGWRIEALTDKDNVEFRRGLDREWVTAVVTKPLVSLIDSAPDDVFQIQSAPEQLQLRPLPALTFFLLVVIFTLALTKRHTFRMPKILIRPKIRTWLQKCNAAFGVIISRPIIPDPLAIVRPPQRLSYRTVWLEGHELQQKRRSKALERSLRWPP